MVNELPAGAPEMPWLVAVPLLAACATLIARRGTAALGLSASVGVAGLTAWLIRRLVLEGPQRMSVGGWGEPLGITLLADGLSGCMLGTTALVGLLVSVHASAYFGPKADGERSRAFWPLWMFLCAALNALILAADVFNIYVALELLGLSAVALVALSPEAPAVSAAVRYLLVSLTGSLCYLMGAAFLYGGAGVLGFDSLAGVLQPEPYGFVALALMSAGLCMKSALFPLHAWLPPAHANAPAPVSAVLSALVVKASFFVLLRLWLGVFDRLVAPEMTLIPGLLGAAAVVAGSVRALSAPRLKQVIAYSTVAQIGYLFMGFPLGSSPATRWAAVGGVTYLVAAHACAKAAAFLAAGNVLRAYGHDRIDDLRGVVQQMPVSMFAFAVAGVSLIGLPPSGGFIAKWLLLSAAMAGGRWGYAAVIVGGGLLATAYVFRVFSRSFRNLPGGPGAGAFRGVSGRMEWSALTLALCSMLIGVTGAYVLELVQPGATLIALPAPEAAR
jgi:formate hydrogenlyase subunit 3/multisubunit Na+/H+ antiporter MnhD subunit